MLFARLRRLHKISVTSHTTRYMQYLQLHICIQMQTLCVICDTASKAGELESKRTRRNDGKSKQGRKRNRERRRRAVVLYNEIYTSYDFHAHILTTDPYTDIKVIQQQCACIRCVRIEFVWVF